LSGVSLRRNGLLHRFQAKVALLLAGNWVSLMALICCFRSEGIINALENQPR
jgi:hypothetical protein